MFEKLGEAGLVTVGKVVDAWRSGQADSYIDYTRPSRVEPLMIVDSSLLFNENTPIVTQSLLSAFAAYYLLAWNQMMVSIDNVQVARTLDKLNPNRSLKDTAVDTAGAIWMLSNENFSYRLPSFARPRPSNESNQPVNTLGFMENMLKESDKRSEKMVKELRNDLKKQRDDDKADDNQRDLMTPGGLVNRSTEVIKEQTNLSVGKLLEVQISNGQRKDTLPIMIRLQASTMVPDLLSELLSTGNVDNSVSNRWIKYRSGQINLIDLLTTRDLVRQHRKNLMTDKTGVYTSLATQRRNNKLSGLISLNPSVANSTNLVVVSTETIKKVELAMGDKFSNFKAREKLFDATGLMIVAVVDPEYDRVKFYTAGMPSVSDLSIRECKAANQKEGASITDILKAYQLGNAPSF